MNKQNVIDFFDKAAAGWDRVNGQNRQAVAFILDHAGLFPGARVLDVACGTGVLFPEYRARAVGQLTGVDISREMIRAAQAKFPEARLLCADAETEPLGEFDCIVVYNAFPHFAEPERLIRKLASELAPGGTLTVASRHVTLGYASPWTSLVTGYTCSFYAKGPAGAKVTARVVLAPLTDADMSAIEKKSSSTTNWKPLANAPLIAETAEPRTWELNGEWQRFYATSRFDNRTAAVGRDVSLVIETDAPVELKDFQYQQVSQYPSLEKFAPTVYVDGGQSVKIRGSVAVWCCGRDGKLERYDKGRRGDDIYSWSHNQVEK